MENCYWDRSREIKMLKNKNIAIIGGGIIGLAVAYKLSDQGALVHVFEKESSVGLHQSGRNSGVLHCGLYYEPGSLKAELSVNGIREMISFCETHAIANDVCGKVVVATTQKEVQALDYLARRGKKNGLNGLQYLSKEELKIREPFVRAEKALLVPEEGIVDYSAVMQKMVNLIQHNNGQVSYNTKVSSIDQSSENEVLLSTIKSNYTFDYLVSCTGLWSDKTYTNLTQQKPPLRIVPFRGEYLKFKQGFEDRINHLVYPVPDAQFPFLGVHFTRMIDGTREVGPNAVLALKREGYSKTSFSLRDSFESLTYPGLLRFVGNNLSFSVNEFKSSLLMKDFIAKAQKMIPDVDASMLETGPAGVRAQAISKEGKLQMDFNIIRKGRQIHVLNAPSPGATASLAIASHIIENYLDKN
jgi:(S)-2-hydroxyglutarate dehydrogenase